MTSWALSMACSTRHLLRTSGRCQALLRHCLLLPCTHSGAADQRVRSCVCWTVRRWSRWYADRMTLRERGGCAALLRDRASVAVSYGAERAAVVFAMVVQGTMRALSALLPPEEEDDDDGVLRSTSSSVNLPPGGWANAVGSVARVMASRGVPINERRPDRFLRRRPARRIR